MIAQHIHIIINNNMNYDNINIKDYGIFMCSLGGGH